MIKKLKAMKAKHKELEMTLKSLIKKPHVNEMQVREIKKKKLRIKDTIMNLVKIQQVSRNKAQHKNQTVFHT